MASPKETVGEAFQMVEAGMLELILLAIAVALVSAVTHDLVLSDHRGDTDVQNSQRHKLTR